MYTPKVMDHFKNPRNMGEIKNPDAVGQEGNPICGDVMKIYLKIGKKKIDGKEVEYIKDIKFQTMGCVAALSTSSMLTELAKGKTLSEARKITNKDVADALDGLPNIKMHCSNLAQETLQRALENWEKKKNNKT